MYMFFMVVHIFVSLVLIGVILMQAGRGGGVSEIFGGGGTQTIFGTSATKFLQRATAACAIIFIITSLSLAILSSRRSKSLMESRGAALMDVEEAAEEAVKWGGEETAEEAVEETGDVPQEDVMPTEDEKEPIEPISE